MDDRKFTEVSGKAFDHIIYGHMSPAEAANYLRTKPTIVRGVGETLRGMYKGGNLKGDIKEFLLAIDPSLNPNSIGKNIDNWLNDRNVPSRENIFKIAFALGLAEGQLDYLLSIADGYAIQYRDVREMTLAWHLREGLPYTDAIAFCESLPPYRLREVDSQEHTHLTQKIANESRAVHTTEGLHAVCDRNSSDFGTHHLRAHYHFERLLSKLVKPDSPASGSQKSTDKQPHGLFSKFSSFVKSPSGKATNQSNTDVLPEEDEYSIESIMEDYLTLSMPSTRSRKGFQPIQKLLKANWPNLTALKDIRNHDKDVPRKLLLLLYVVTEYAGIDTEADNMLAFDETFEDRVRDHMLIIDAIMDDCGMARLDMRNAFDWLIMYSIAVEDEDDENVRIEDYEGMSDRMEAVISEMFSNLDD